MNVAQRIINKNVLVSLALTIGCLLVVVSAGTQKAGAFSDNVWWGSCSGRYIVGSVRLGSSGNMTVYGCNNGYFFVNVKSNYNANNYASITRTSPYYKYIYASGYGYSTTTYMVARLSGGCYSTWASINTWTSNGFKFCW